MSLEAWGDENPYDDETWADRAAEAGWDDLNDFSPGAVAILRERERQETEEGWKPAHDDKHTDGSLVDAAIAYLAMNHAYHLPEWADYMSRQRRPKHWPISWSLSWWKPKDKRADLVRAGALIAAEIDRLDRLQTTLPE